MKDWNRALSDYQEIAEYVLKQANRLGASAAEVSCIQTQGLMVTVRQQSVDALQYQQEQMVLLTVYVNKQKGEASTTDLSKSALDSTLDAAYRIATLTRSDSANGLPAPSDLVKEYPDLDLHHPWRLGATEAIDLAKSCEAQAMERDKRICLSDGVGVDTIESMVLIANSSGFMGSYLSSRHSMDCNLVASDPNGLMQRDGSYTSNRNPNNLSAVALIANQAVERTVRRLGARRIKTCEVPVIFEAEIADTLINYFLQAIAGSALYQKASFLLEALDKPIFPKHISIEECPYEPGALGSAPFDSEGVAPKPRYLVEDGVLRSYLLSSYSARRLGLSTTGNAGGYYTIKLGAQVPSLDSLLANMGTGLLVTEVIGHGINLVTGDYSQGASGFWVEHGRIQYPVEELTVAGNLKDMYRQLVAIASDTNQTSRIQTGSVLIERMVVAGE